MESSFNQMLLDCYGLFYWEFNPDGQLLDHNIDSNLVNLLLSIFVGRHGIINEIAHYPRQTPFLFEDHQEKFYIVGEESETHNICIYGPVAIGLHQLHQISADLTQLIQYEAPDVNITPLVRQLKITPLTQLISIARECCYQLTHQVVDRGQILIVSSKITTTHNAMASRELSAHQDAYQAESAIFNCVKDGNIDYQNVLDASSQVSNGVHIEMGSLQQAKLNLLTLNFLCSRAAIVGGVSPSIIYTLADQYTDECIRCDDRSTLQSLATTLMSDYVTRVHQLKKRQLALTPPIATCKEFIDLNIQEKIDLRQLTTVSGYSYYYLSHEFNRQLGCSINHYINQAKVEAAKRLLRTSRKSASEIADSLHFSSPSYFSKIFRQLTGITPRDYRQKAATK